MATDVLGNTVIPGDRIAVSFREGNIAQLRIGVVMGFSKRSSAHYTDSDTIQVQWTGEGSNWNAKDMAGKTTSIQTDHPKYIRL